MATERMQTTHTHDGKHVRDMSVVIVDRHKNWSCNERQPSKWQCNVREWDGENDMFEDCEYNCILYKKSSRRTDHRYLVATLVGNFRGRAPLRMETNNLSSSEHDESMEKSRGASGKKEDGKS